MENNTILMLEELYRCFDKMNEDKFGGTLERPMITISYDKKAMGTCTTKRFWYNSEKQEELDKMQSDELETAGSYYQINISSNFLNSGVENLGQVLLHEMVHLFNSQNGIKDCSGKKHNKKFKKKAEEVDLDCGENDSKIGYGYTSATESLKKYFVEELKMNEEVFKCYFMLPPKSNVEKLIQKKFNITYYCPDCNLEVKFEEAFSMYEGFNPGCCPECGKEYQLKPKGKRGRKAKED